MKARKQPERQARQRRVKSDPQIKQPKLKQQIQPRSVSTSCSSSRPSQLRKNRESRLANMATRKHIWSEEEEFLLEYFKDPCMVPLYKSCKNHFYGRLAEAMNRHWVDERKDPEYVPLTIDTAKTKFKQFVTSWKAHCSSATERVAVSREAGHQERAAKVVDLFDVEAKKIALKERLVHVQEEIVKNQRAIMQLQMEEAQAAREDREERIMTMELGNLSEEARAYWKGRQTEILKRRNWSA